MTQHGKSCLFEDQASSNRSKARRYMRKESGMTDDESMELDQELRVRFDNANKCDCKFMLGLTRMYMDGELNDNNTAQAVNQALGIVAEEPYAIKFDRDLNGMTAQQFIDVFKDKVEAAGNADKDNLSKQDFGGNNGYDIVLIDSFEKASKYSKHTSWCVTQSESAYNSYTKGGTFYFCLENGFEKVEKVAGANTPLDEYGLSMIAVSIYPDGKCNTITCRWNHDNGGNDHIISTEWLSNVIGENFYDVFKPVKRTMILGGKEYIVGITEDEYSALYDEKGNNILGDGVNDFWLDAQMSNAFGVDVLFVKAEMCVNFLLFKDGDAQYLFDKWFDWCGYDNVLSNAVGVPCFRVCYNFKENYVICRDGIIQFLFDEWYNKCWYDKVISDMLGIICFEIKKGTNTNYATYQDGIMKYLFDEEFDLCEYAYSLSKMLGVPCFDITNNGKKNYVIYRDDTIQYLFDDELDWCVYEYNLSETFGYPCFKLTKNGKFNCAIIKYGKIQYLLDKWVYREELGSILNNYLKQRNEGHLRHLSNIIAEIVMRKLQ